MLPGDHLLRSLSFPEGPPPTAAHLSSQIWTKTSGFSQRLLFLFMVTVLSLPAAATGGFFFLPSPHIDPPSVAQSCTEIWDQAGAGAELRAEAYPALPWQPFPAGSSQAQVNYSNVRAPVEPGARRIDLASQHLPPRLLVPLGLVAGLCPLEGCRDLERQHQPSGARVGRMCIEPQLALPAPGSDTALPVTFTARSKSQSHPTFRWGGA